MLRSGLILFLISLSFRAEAQLSTSNALTADQLVRNVLAGEGVEISNVSFTGSDLAKGTFDGSSSNIGLNEGVILSTGSVLDHLHPNGTGKNGPVGPNNAEQASTDHGLPGDSLVKVLSGGPAQSYDAAVLEFDFIPEGDTIRFRYVFASEEYPRYVGTPNNDAFGFFISGQGILGVKNIALLPDNSTPVSINNVNAGANSTYFIENGTGKIGEPQFNDASVVNFNGFTVVLEAVAKVTPCETYHLKIAIADINDRKIDSGVFLEANSLQSVPQFEISQQVDYAPSGSTVEIFEGCSKGELHITRSKKTDLPLTIPFKIYGTAGSGDDYTPIPTTVNFSPGETSKVIQIDPVRDPIDDDGETIVLRFKNPSVCEDDSIDIIYTLRDQPELLSKVKTQSVICPGEDLVLEPDVSGGIPTYSYSWTGIGIGDEVTVNPTQSTTYYYEATDACGQFVNDSVVVDVPVYSALMSVPMNDTTIRCRGENVVSVALGQGGAGGYNYSWSSGQTGESATHEILETSTYTVTISDQCGNTTKDDVQITLNYPAFTASASNDTLICVGDVVQVSGDAQGGIPPYSYSWEGVPGQIYEHTGGVSETILLTVFDSCQIIPATEPVLVEVQQPFANFEINAPIPEPNENIVMLNNSQDAVAYQWDLGNGEESTDRNPNTSYPEVEPYSVQLIAIDVLGCRDTATQTVTLQHPLYYYLPNAFSPNGDDLNDILLGKHIGVTNFDLWILDSWGRILFYSDDPNKGWDGTSKSGKTLPIGVYIVKYKATSTYRENKVIEKVSTVTLVR